MKTSRYTEAQIIAILLQAKAACRWPSFAVSMA